MARLRDMLTTPSVDDLECGDEGVLEDKLEGEDLVIGDFSSQISRQQISI
jgi:hypothetical protein